MSEARDTLRKALLATQKRASKTITFFGQQVEVRQPLLGDILDAPINAMNQKDALIAMIVKYTFVPGTDEPVFEEGDKEQLLQMPFGADLTAINEAMTAMTSINFQPPGSGSGQTPSATSPSESPTSSA
jgi:hypothetical protein